jgi:hypothetical protein
MEILNSPSLNESSNKDIEKESSVMDFVLNLSSNINKQKSQLSQLKSRIQCSSDACSFTYSWEVLLYDDRINKQNLIIIANYLLKESSSFNLIVLTKKIVKYVIIEYNRLKDFEKEFNEFIDIVVKKEIVSSQDIDYLLLELDLKICVSFDTETLSSRLNDKVLINKCLEKNIISENSVVSYEYLSQVVERINTSVTILSNLENLINQLNEDV